ncbi:MAG: PAS domain S-box protein [Terriglobia bacterium]
MAASVNRIPHDQTGALRLRTAGALLDLIENQTSDVISIANLEGRLRYISPSCRGLFGYEPAELLGHSFHKLVHSADYAIVDRFFAELTKAGRASAEYRFLGKDGSIRWMESSGSAYCEPEGGMPIEVVAISRDISSRKHAEEALAEQEVRLRDSEEHYRCMVASIEDYSVLKLDPGGRIVSSTHAAGRISGNDAGEIFGKHISCLFTREDIACGHADEVLVIAAAEGRVDEEGLRVREDGSTFWAAVSITAMRDEGGRLRGFCKVTRDITERKQAEQQLVSALRCAEQASRAKSDFLATMSHELRTPMNVILGMADVLWESNLNADQRQCVEVARRAGSGLLALIDNILDLSKFDAGGIELERTDFDLRVLLDEVVKAIAPKARAKGLNVRCEVAPGLAAPLSGDPARLRQILTNLLGNAVKFTNKGEVRVAVRPMSADSGLVEFSVADTGIGIDEEHLSTIFDDFRQGDASINRRYGGAGLGLGISRRLVEHMGGRLTVKSEVRQGTTFRFALALRRAAKPAETGAEFPRDLKGLRAALVPGQGGAHQNDRLGLRRSMESLGLEIRDFQTTQDALVSLGVVPFGEKPYALAVIHGWLGSEEAFTIAGNIRTAHPALPIVLLSPAHDLQFDEIAHRCAKLNIHTARLTACGGWLPVIAGAIGDSRGAAVVHGAKEPMRIVLAEDSVDSQILMRHYMQGSSHTLTIACDGQEAIDAVEAATATFDILLMDLQMPGVDGFTAVRRIRELERQSGATPLPIVALSANARPVDVEMSLEAGCNGHLSKPISKRVLMRALDHYTQPR